LKDLNKSLVFLLSSFIFSSTLSLLSHQISLLSSAHLGEDIVSLIKRQMKINDSAGNCGKSIELVKNF